MLAHMASVHGPWTWFLHGVPCWMRLRKLRGQCGQASSKEPRVGRTHLRFPKFWIKCSNFGGFQWFLFCEGSLEADLKTNGQLTLVTYLCVLRRDSKPRRESDILDYRPLECCYLFTQKPHRSLHSLSSVGSLEAKNILKPPAPIETTLWKGELSWNQSWKTQGNQQTPGTK